MDVPVYLVIDRDFRWWQFAPASKASKLSIATHIIDGVVYTDGKMLPPLPWGRKFGLEKSKFKDELCDKNSRRLPISELKR